MKPPAVCIALVSCLSIPAVAQEERSTNAPIAQPTDGEEGESGPASGPASKSAYDERKEEISRFVNVILSIPDVPAAFTVGIAADQIARPGTVRESASQLASFLGQDGQIKSGIAAEIAPFRLLGERKSVDEWRTAGTFGRIADSLRISIATAEDPAAIIDNAPPVAAFGARVAIIDERDYRWNATVVTAVRDALTAGFPKGGELRPGPGDQVGDVTSPAKTSADDSLDELLATIYHDMMTGHRLELAATTSFTASNVLGRNGSDTDWRELRGWVAYEYAGTGGNVGATLDMAYRDEDEFMTSATHDIDLRTAARAGLESTHASGDLYAGFASLRNAGGRDNGLMIGASVALEVGDRFTVKTGIQAVCTFRNDSPCRGLVLLSLALANAENPLFTTVRGH